MERPDPRGKTKATAGELQVSRGHDRERRVRDWLTERDWVVVRAAGSLGGIDLVAMKAGHTPMLVEVKATAGGPYERFNPADRADLKKRAEWAGAEAWLAWWPPRGKLRWIPSSEWPPTPSLKLIVGNAAHVPPSEDYEPDLKIHR